MPPQTCRGSSPHAPSLLSHRMQVAQSAHVRTVEGGGPQHGIREAPGSRPLPDTAGCAHTGGKPRHGGAVGVRGCPGGTVEGQVACR